MIALHSIFFSENVFGCFCGLESMKQTKAVYLTS